MHGGSGLSEFFFSVSFGIDITFKKHASIPETMPAENVTITAEFEKYYVCPDCGNEILGEDAISENPQIRRPTESVGF